VDTSSGQTKLDNLRRQCRNRRHAKLPIPPEEMRRDAFQPLSLMKSRTRWVIVDTETDGLYDPIHIVELAAQLMEGWDPVGKPFRMLLNHGVPIPADVVAIHGYTREFLKANGGDPLYVYELFREYARDYPLVAHNLSFDWNRCLTPEWARLGIPRIGQRGFCSMTLARRLIPETRSCRLDVLKQHFHLRPLQSHRAENDVLAVVDLFQAVYRPRLEPAGLDTFQAVARFSKRSPVAKCLETIRNAALENGGTKTGATRPQHLPGP
jgi:DNA polymerase III subunit epsilon